MHTYNTVTSASGHFIAPFIKVLTLKLQSGPCSGCLIPLALLSSHGARPLDRLFNVRN